MNGEIDYLLNDSERLILLIEGENNADRKEALSKNIEEMRRILGGQSESKPKSPC